MRMRRLSIFGGILVLACTALVPMQAGQGGAGGGQRGGGGRADAPTIGPGNLVTGVWGADAVALDSRGWGWMTRSYVNTNYKRPFYN
jgi:hypothetical protein